MSGRPLPVNFILCLALWITSSVSISVACMGMHYA